MLIIGSQLRYYEITLSEQLKQFTFNVLHHGDTATLFHGKEKDVCAIILTNYYSILPNGISVGECPSGEDVGIVAYQKLQPLYPSVVFFLFSMKGRNVLSGRPNLVRMEPALSIDQNMLVQIIAKGLKIRRAKSTPSSVH
ncbi:MAG: hypothetical protein KBC33_00995 [Candidatus Pacebacteria bacterium]|nr:hypothetical protein [Candidatus Paceibacterota bacterium]